MLFAADRRERAFSRDEVALLSSLAAHAAVALDNARLLAETRDALISLEQANAALREQSGDIELAVLAHDRLAELVLRGGGVAEVAAELADVLGGTVDLQVPMPADEPIGPSQSSVTGVHRVRGAGPAGADPDRARRDPPTCGCWNAAPWSPHCCCCSTGTWPRWPTADGATCWRTCSPVRSSTPTRSPPGPRISTPT